MLFLLLYDCVVKRLLHLFVSYLVLLHNCTNLLRVCLHHLLHLAMNVNVLHLIRGAVVLVVVCLEVPAINVVSNVSRFCSKILNEIPLLQCTVSHHSSQSRFGNSL